MQRLDAGLAEAAIPELREFELRREADAATGRIRLRKVEVMRSTSNAPAYAKDSGSSCRYGCKKGVFHIPTDIEVNGGIAETTSVVKCACKTAAELGQSITSFHDVFGCWPALKGQEPKPLLKVPPSPPKAPEPQAVAQDPAPIIREVIDYDDLE